MKTSLIIFSTLLSLTSAQNAIINNNYSTTIYVYAPSPLTIIPLGGIFLEKFRASGLTIKIAKTKILDKPLFFSYSFSSNPDYVYYDNEWGNPFIVNHNMLSPGEGCKEVNCVANNTGCYSMLAYKKVYSLSLSTQSLGRVVKDSITVSHKEKIVGGKSIGVSQLDELRFVGTHGGSIKTDLQPHLCSDNQSCCYSCACACRSSVCSHGKTMALASFNAASPAWSPSAILLKSISTTP
ncbi:uncharacterized protein P174DRAFT_460862 [Aspergillus novofumigatus IBT 16806]|uniref:Uncharacterized protein n=1 Tax=Aspergillus novofumigatus (strain IBT 16806) TaxID=1392255 RepID=A0A2I1C3W2_ASPN1|nr:uncharacterized protein P174DRAFT_460862 [Aspergillus novofumigatus IBT 16806]PKX92271.1 hypothetical protein P174DRAFT_460862 [Aspergillus novofumigatus IBT 16806]